MNIDIDNLRISLAQSFNKLLESFNELDGDQEEAFRELRQNIAFLLLTYHPSVGMKKLDPDRHLRRVAK